MDNTLRKKIKQTEMDLRFTRSLRVEEGRLTVKNQEKKKADKVLGDVVLHWSCK